MVKTSTSWILRREDKWTLPGCLVGGILIILDCFASRGLQSFYAVGTVVAKTSSSWILKSA